MTNAIDHLRTALLFAHRLSSIRLDRQVTLVKALVRKLAIIVAVWTALALLNAAAMLWFRHALDQPTDFWTLLERPLMEAWIWAALTPFALQAARRFPLRVATLPRYLPIHFSIFFALYFLHCLIAQWLSVPMAAIPASYQGSQLQLRLVEQLYTDTWMYWPIVCIQTLIDMHRRARERERHAAQLETLLSSSQLALLRAQIQPHFLFNTLHAINSLIRIDARAAEDMVADFANILRASFSDLALQETTLRRELELVECYLRIQRRRFSDRLHVAYDIGPETLDAAVPALLVESLVENAVTHGIAPSARVGTVRVEAHAEGGRLALDISDDGVGMRTSSREGVGLTNARARLQRLYGEEHSMALTSAPGFGTRVKICIPLRAAPTSEEQREPNPYRWLTDTDLAPVK
jgi:two-component system LytT family sensor kinase